MPARPRHRIGPGDETPPVFRSRDARGGGMLGAIKAMSGFDVTNNSWGWTSKWADLSTGSASFGGQLVSVP